MRTGPPVPGNFGRGASLVGKVCVAVCNGSYEAYWMYEAYEVYDANREFRET